MATDFFPHRDTRRGAGLAPVDKANSQHLPFPFLHSSSSSVSPLSSPNPKDPSSSHSVSPHSELGSNHCLSHPIPPKSPTHPIRSSPAKRGLYPYLDSAAGAMASGSEQPQAETEPEAVELVLFQVAECYVYLIPPRKTAASYRADEWNVNKWAWEGALKVASKGEECVIKLEDKSTGELYARAFLREGEPHPVEAVIDSSRYFVLRVEENIDGRQRHAFIGLGFRERTEAYDFQAALHDHMKYLNKKKTAEEMVQHYENTSSVDYSLKEGETLVLQLKNKESGSKTKSAFFEQGLNKLSFNEKANTKEATVSLKLPPPPPSPVSPTDSGVAMSPFKAEFPSQEQPGAGDSGDTAPFKAEFPSQGEPVDDTVEAKAEAAPHNQPAAAEKSKQGSVDDEFDFGDFQAAA